MESCAIYLCSTLQRLKQVKLTKDLKLWWKIKTGFNHPPEDKIFHDFSFFICAFRSHFNVSQKIKQRPFGYLIQFSHTQFLLKLLE